MSAAAEEEEEPELASLMLRASQCAACCAVPAGPRLFFHAGMGRPDASSPFLLVSLCCVHLLWKIQLSSSPCVGDLSSTPANLPSVMRKAGRPDVMLLRWGLN
jgi:hypothetical protein